MTNQEFLDSLKIGDKVALVSRMGTAPRCEAIGTVKHVTAGRRMLIRLTHPSESSGI
jgi:hypothetical protein